MHWRQNAGRRVYAEPSEINRTLAADAGRIQPSVSARAAERGPTKVTVSVSTRSACGCIARGIRARQRAGGPANVSTSVVVAPQSASHRANLSRYASAPGGFRSCAAHQMVLMRVDPDPRLPERAAEAAVLAAVAGAFSTRRNETG